MHIPVLLKEVMSALAPQPHEIYVDGTFGGGGYAKAILKGAPCSLIAIDRDEDAIKRAHDLRKSLGLSGKNVWSSNLSSKDPTSDAPPQAPQQLHIAHGPFSELNFFLDALNIPKVHGIVLDLGVSSFQIDEGHRGFSFRFDAPLSMTMGCNDITAFDVVNSYTQADLERIFFEGEEPAARRMAKKIVLARSQKTIETTFELAQIMASCKPYAKDGQHPATVGFQAIRLYVNEELKELKTILNACKTRLFEGGRLVVVTFHSLEDRIVKEFMRNESGYAPLPSRHVPVILKKEEPLFELISKKALTPSVAEQQSNPRSRSAKLRAIRRRFTQSMPPFDEDTLV